MSTESIQSASKTVSRHKETYGVFLTLTNGSGGVLNAGQEVFISGNLTVNKRSTGAQQSIGVVDVGAADAQRVTVHTAFQRTLKAIAKGGGLNAGDRVKPNGVWNAAGLPEYVVCVATDMISGVVLKGGVLDAEIEIGIFRTPYQLN